MNAATETRTVTVERDIPFPPEKIWRALTEPHLIAEWLMKNDFALDVGRRFKLTGDWGSVDCEVLEIEPNRSLSYSWNAMGLESTVTFTLTKTGTGTRLRMDQAGFRTDQEQAFRGAQYGWQKFFANLERLLAKES
ncbi:MAG TPA: SRPBCC domain-containing protein [Rhodanobacteraceae bacterium]|nr:SRPBCC domain-containing protein [Rhodanobacteraceae bacterium]